jgi:hypothetical protein
LLDLRPILAAVHSVLERHALGRPGAYARWTLPHEKQERHFGLDPYGCADAANLLYTLGHFPRQDREHWVATLQGLQERETGLFREATHHPIHTTAHCVAALELFDVAPRAPLHELGALRDADAMQSFLDGLDWSNPWLESHRGAGLYAALTLAGEVDVDWREHYLGWLVAEVDAKTGLWRRGCVPSLEEKPLFVFPHLAGTFHYLFNLEHARVAHPHPQALVDTGLAIFERRLFPFASFVGFAEVDQVYCLTRAVQQCGHRFREVKAALRELAARYVAFLDSLDAASDPGLDDLHALFGAVSCLAELQRFLPGELRSDEPLRLVLDRRPFI